MQISVGCEVAGGRCHAPIRIFSPLPPAASSSAGLHLYTCTCNPPEIGAAETTEEALERFRNTVFARMEALREETAGERVDLILKNSVAHVKLNNRIIREARLFADRFGSEIHFATAYGDRNREPRAADIAAECGVTPAQVHVRHGPAATSILEVADELDVDLVMIGTVGRMGLMGTVLGNTAERVLDETRADVLVFN